MLVGLLIAILLMLSVPLAHVDLLDIWKKEQEKKAIEYQKSILHFDYQKMQKKDKGFKFPIPSDIHKKEIKRFVKQNFAIVKP